jgi:hypothetical protein
VDSDPGFEISLFCDSSLFKLGKAGLGIGDVRGGGAIGVLVSANLTNFQGVFVSKSVFDANQCVGTYLNGRCVADAGAVGVYVENEAQTVFVNISSSVFMDNNATGGGGAVSICCASLKGNRNSTLLFLQNVFERNFALNGEGGGVKVSFDVALDPHEDQSLGNEVKVGSSVFHGNRMNGAAALGGGALSVVFYTTSGSDNFIHIENNSFSHNFAVGTFGGGSVNL